MGKGKFLLFIICVLFTNLLVAGSTRAGSGRRSNDYSCLDSFRLQLHAENSRPIAALNEPSRRIPRKQNDYDVYAELRQRRNYYNGAIHSESIHSPGSGIALLERFYFSSLVQSSRYQFSLPEFHSFIFRLTPF
jgi:hypothetical protein